MLKKLVFSLALAVAANALAQSSAAIQPNSGYSAYLQDGSGAIARTAFGLCWRTAYWTPADAVVGCDGELVPPIVKPTAPPIVPPVAMQPKPATPVAPEPCDFSATIGSDQAFAFNRTVLSSAAKQRIDTDILSKLGNCSKIDLIQITGHADRLGSPQYNQKLSEKRANAVAAYMKGKGVSTEMDIRGAGKSQPVKFCDSKMPRVKLVNCLAPNRRVEIEVRGLGRQ